MKTTTALSLTVLLVAPLGAAPLVGCASDPNKKLKEATAQEAEQSRAEREAQIDLTKKQDEKRIEATRPDTEGLPAATQQRAKAQSDLSEDRQKLEIDARARLQKVMARLEEARQKLQLAGGDAPTVIHDEMNQTVRLANNLNDRLTNLPQVSNDRWSSEKKRVEEQLADIERSADDVKSKADGVRK